MKDERLISTVEKILMVLIQLQELAESGLLKGRGAEEEWLDAVDLMQKVHISRTTLHRWKKEGFLVTKKLGKKEYYLIREQGNDLKGKAESGEL